MDLWFIGSLRHSSVKRKHSPIFSGETKASPTLMHDYKNTMHVLTLKQTFQVTVKRKINQDIKSELVINGFNNLQEITCSSHHADIV